jgi:hypothetical protein
MPNRDLDLCCPPAQAPRGRPPEAFTAALALDAMLWDLVEAVLEHGTDSACVLLAQQRLAAAYAGLLETCRATPLLRRVARQCHARWGRMALARCRGFGERNFPEPDDFDDDFGIEGEPGRRRH